MLNKHRHVWDNRRDIVTFQSCYTYKWVMSRIWMSHGTHMKESCHTYEWVMAQLWMSHVTHMGWLRLVGSLKLYVSFAEYCLFYRALLQKRPIILRSLLIEATPYQWDIGTIQSCVTHTHKSWRTHGWVMPHAWTSHVTCMNESCHTL